MKAFIILLFTCCVGSAYAQYAPQVGQPGCDAISVYSGVFVDWATHCTVQRGLMNIADPSLGYVSAGDSSLATGPADGSVVSLGDSGVAVLTFASPISDGPGTDFAVFENGFINSADSTQAFLELGFVEVSSDGINFFRFPANSFTQYDVQIENGSYITASKIQNLAGKYLGSWGTPFDLHELAGVTGLDINHINYVRIIDVVGDIGSHASHDSAGRVINDPFPTPFPIGGFDLDGIGVIHNVATGVRNVQGDISLSVYPNPATDMITVSVKGTSTELYATLTSITGVVLHRQVISQVDNNMSIAQLPAGMYYLMLHDANGNQWVEKISKR